MATTLLALLDDIASLLDDVAAMSKVAARKTAGVLGDDLALNAQQITGVNADRELPVVWAVAKGSLLNKVILVPAALLMSWALPWLITPLLVAGGAFLCFEGFEKIAHRWLPGRHDASSSSSVSPPKALAPIADGVALERDKIRGAVRTDFILSAEIVVITLGSVAAAPFVTRVLVLSSVALLMTLGVYGFVAAIIKLDDLGLYWQRSSRSSLQTMGRALVAAAPGLMKVLSGLGMLAMFMVGGGIVLHSVPSLAHGFESWAETLPVPLGVMLSSGGAMGLGLVVGAVVYATTPLVSRAARSAIAWRQRS